ncbi:hypothetical protein [Dysosmobacter sp.]|uniref:hypothetical protein n=1 Tax=Dysosmobacter sp. TaxID=2591382 RepID=UPI002A8A15BB|nr:hypothetical protein [Dysosmobacter sp.]MDY3281173.1 hypothetical protein [Dysosmobacter sp.]
MLTMKLLPDRESFFNLVARSRGSVLLQLPDQTACDLKHDPAARQMLRLLEPGPEGISLRLSDPADLPAYLRYMMEAGRA